MRGSVRGARHTIVAILACLQIGIEPAVLPLMISIGSIGASHCGWVVGAGQAGLSAGAALAWRTSHWRWQRMIRPTALGSLISALALASATGLAQVLVLRFVFGFGMGVCLAVATAAAARERPHQAAGLIVFGQQLTATIVMTVMANAATSYGPARALLLLAAAPAVIALLGCSEPAPQAATTSEPHESGTVGRRALVPLALLLGLTAMTWSYVTSIGVALGYGEARVLLAIALTSLASALAAMILAVSRPRLSPLVSAAVSTAGLIAPFLLPSDAPFAAYVTTLIAFNVAATIPGTRFVGWALASKLECERRRVVLIECSAMALGAPLGALAVSTGGLPLLALIASATGLAATFLSHAIEVRSDYGSSPAATNFERSAATADGPRLPSLRAAAISPAVNAAGLRPLEGGASWRAWVNRSARL